MTPRRRAQLLDHLAEDNGKDSDKRDLPPGTSAPVDDLDDMTRTYDRRRPPMPPAPPPPADPLIGIVRSLRNLRWAVVAIAIPVIASGKLVVSHMLDRVESSTVQRIEHARLVEDVRSLKVRAEEQAHALRNAEEALRLQAARLQHLLGDRSPPWK